MEKSEILGVVGAGLMGAEIGLLKALAGYKVVLVERQAEALDRAMDRLAKLIEKGIARGFYAEGEAALTRIRPTTSIDELGPCDIVTEAVFEDREAKAEVLSRLDAVLPDHAVIATNTSTIPISALASHLFEERRANFIGTHYFSPASRMKLVEVIPAATTSAATLERAMRLMRELGKTAVQVRDVPGFAVNRLLHVLMIEAVRLVEEDVISVEDLDTACKLGLGHPMGPFELYDATTSSLCLQAQQLMFEAYGERFRPRPLLAQRVAAGFVGGRGKPGWRTRGDG